MEKVALRKQNIMKSIGQKLNQEFFMVLLKYKNVLQTTFNRFGSFYW